ncbi:hypothetical protein PFISCL1PPCAC_1145, partial [Pristionchus fissidentatus]
MANHFLNWILNHKVEDIDDFVNFSSSALLLSNESIICTPSDEFRIPSFLILKELMKESSEGITSSKIRAFLIHLLRLVCQDNTIISDTNYNQKLRGFLDRQYILPDTRNPLDTEENFHSLPSSVKMWIITSLMTNCGRNIVQNEQKSIGIDSLGNEYYLVNENYLFIKYGKVLQDRVKKEDTMGDEYSLERYIHKQSSTNSWKLMANSKDDLEYVGLCLKRYKEEDIAKYLLRKVEQRNANQVPEESEDARAQEF